MLCRIFLKPTSLVLMLLEKRYTNIVNIEMFMLVQIVVFNMYIVSKMGLMDTTVVQLLMDRELSK